MCFAWRFYGRFLTAISIRAPTKATATIITITPTAKYMSVGGRAATGDDGVGVAFETNVVVSAGEPK